MTKHPCSVKHYIHNVKKKDMMKRVSLCTNIPAAKEVYR